MSRKMFTGNAGDSPGGTRISGHELLSIDSHLLREETTSCTRYEQSFNSICMDSDGQTFGIQTARCAPLNLPAAQSHLYEYSYWVNFFQET